MRRSTLFIFLLFMSAVATLAAPTSAEAELSPNADPIWGVEGVMASESNNFDASVWAIEQIGNVIYVGGKFTSVTSGPGGQSSPRLALAAFNASNGQWISTFLPDVQGGSVFALEASPDGTRLFLAGDFTSIAGAPDTAGLAAINPSTGALDPTWRAGLERPWSTRHAIGRAIDIQNDWLYVGGTFSHVRSGSSFQRHSRVARVNLGTGAPDLAFDPVVAGGGVWDIDPSPDGTRLYVAGFFTTVNGDAANGDRFAAVQTANGDLVDGVQPFTPNLESTGRQYAVIATDTKVFVAGEEHMIQVLDADTLTRVQVHFTGTPSFINPWPLSGGGDFQTLERVGNRVYAGCHCWSYHLEPSTGGQLFPTLQAPDGNWTPVNSVLAYEAETGAHIESFAVELSGKSGTWAIHGSPNQCLWVGGQLSQSAGNWVGNMARFCQAGQQVDNERPSTPGGLRDDNGGAAEIALRWTGSSDNVAVVGYEIYRSTNGTLGPALATTSVNDPSGGTEFVDTTPVDGTSYSYAVKAFDAAGNYSWRSNLVALEAGSQADTQRPSSPKGLALSSADLTTITLAWADSTDNVGVTGYEIYRSTNGTLGPLLGTSTTNGYQDTTATVGTVYTYAVKALDQAGNTSWRSNLATGSTSAATDSERPSTPTGLQAELANADVTLDWNDSTDNVGVTGYEIYRSTDGTLGPLLGTSSTSDFQDTTAVAGTTYSYAVKAVDEAGNTSWRSNLTPITP